MATVTLATLRSKVRTRADMPTASFITDAELDEIINSAWGELYDLLVGTFEDYNLSSGTISVVSGTDTYSLASDFYKVRGVDLLISGAAGNFVPLKRYEWSERGDLSSVYRGATLVSGGESLRYTIRGDATGNPKIVFAPVPDGSYSVKVWYVPERVTLTVVQDLILVASWEEFLVTLAAKMCLAKEENEVGHLEADLARLRARIAAAAGQRDADAPRTMVRRRGRGGDCG